MPSLPDAAEIAAIVEHVACPTPSCLAPAGSPCVDRTDAYLEVHRPRVGVYRALTSPPPPSRVSSAPLPPAAPQPGGGMRLIAHARGTATPGGGEGGSDG